MNCSCPDDGILLEIPDENCPFDLKQVQRLAFATQGKVIWDSATGVRRQYCVPDYEEVDIQASMIWSPDNRYLAFRSRLPENRQFSASPIPTFILDTQTGSITEISDVARDLIVWVGEVTE